MAMKDGGQQILRDVREPSGPGFVSYAGHLSVCHGICPATNAWINSMLEKAGFCRPPLEVYHAKCELGGGLDRKEEADWVQPYVKSHLTAEATFLEAEAGGTQTALMEICVLDCRASRAY
jgi:hypothetical protein